MVISVTDDDIAVLAEECINRLGDDAKAFVARRIAHHMLSEEADGCKIWLRVLATVHEIQNGGRAHSQQVH